MEETQEANLLPAASQPAAA